MHPDIERLVDLQVVDTRLNALRARLAAFPQQLAEVEKHATEAKQQLAATKEALTGSLKARKTYEMDVESWKEKARKYRDQSSAVKTNEAYKALQHEIQHAEEEAAQAEDRLLERMMAGEAFEPQVKAAELAVKQAEAATEGDRKKIKAEYDVVQREITATEAERKEKVAKVSEDLFEMYERISKRRHGVGLSEVRDEACSQCGVRIIPHIFQELRRADCFDIFQCETCTRILYYHEPVPAPADADANASAANAAGEPANKG